MTIPKHLFSPLSGMKPQYLRFARLSIVLVALGACALSVGTAAESGKHKAKAKAKAKAKIDSAKQAEETAALFGDRAPVEIKIEIPKEGMAVLEKYNWQFGPRETRESVQVTVREGEVVYTNVALHLKGAAGSFRKITDNPALTLNFDKHAPGQRFHGLTKLSLNNSVQDSTFLSEQFCRELFLKAGVPTPRAGHAIVELNGRDLGLYVLVEGFNKQFLKGHFKNPDGNLYDGGFVKDITEELALNAGSNPKDQSDRIALAKAASEVKGTNGLAGLEKVLDVDRFLTYVALDVMLWDWDGYPMNKNNWRVYHDPDSGKMVFMPHGLDQMLWKPEGPLLPPMQGLVARAALQIPELRARYFEQVKKLRATVFQVEAMTNRVRAIASRIAPVLKRKNPDGAEQYERGVADFCESIALRVKSIDEQLANPITPLDFDKAGFARLAKWEAKPVFGQPAMTREPGENGGEYLHLTTKKGSSIGTWRSKVWLEQGSYVVEGRVKTKGIVADIGDSRGGAGLGLAKSRPEKPLLGTTDWTAFKHEFTVNDPIGEAQVVCEFRGAEGEAWFDLQSLRLKRLTPSSK